MSIRWLTIHITLRRRLKVSYFSCGVCVFLFPTHSFLYLHLLLLLWHYNHPLSWFHAMTVPITNVNVIVVIITISTIIVKSCVKSFKLSINFNTLNREQGTDYSYLISYKTTNVEPINVTLNMISKRTRKSQDRPKGIDSNCTRRTRILSVNHFQHKFFIPTNLKFLHWIGN